MLPQAAPEDDPLTQDAVDPTDTGHHRTDPAVDRWYLRADERGNPETDLRVYSEGNRVTPLVDGATYFRRLYEEICRLTAGDQVYFLDFRGDMAERLDGPGTEVGRVLSAAAERGVLVFGLLWRSHPGFLDQSEEANADLARFLDEHGGQVLLDARTRRTGSHHQKLFVIRRPGHRDEDVAFVGGIDLGLSRRDDHEHGGDPQVMDFPSAYSARPPWHDVQAEVRGPAVHDLEHTFRERWYGSHVLDIPSPIRQLYDRVYHSGSMTGRPLPAPLDDDPTPRGTQAVQVLRTYPARMRRYPFAPMGERSIARAYRKVLPQAHRLVYLEDQFFWSAEVGEVVARALRSDPRLHVVAVVPRYPDREGRLAQLPSHLGRILAAERCLAAAPDRFAMYDVENHAGTPIYTHGKVVVVDDVWAMVGSDNLNRRSWTHDSELSIAVLDSERDGREPLDPPGQGDGARRFARDLRLRLMAEHLDRPTDDADALADLVDPVSAVTALRCAADALQAWYDGGRQGPRPPGRLRPHRLPHLTPAQRAWATPLYRGLYDPDGRAWRDRLRRRR
jgi:phosphatidylserine/phosphatidylglycerophosphate/cardiolipin synthase-like enzyme